MKIYFDFIYFFCLGRPLVGSAWGGAADAVRTPLSGGGAWVPVGAAGLVFVAGPSSCCFLPLSAGGVAAACPESGAIAGRGSSVGGGRWGRIACVRFCRVSRCGVDCMRAVLSDRSLGAGRLRAKAVSKPLPRCWASPRSGTPLRLLPAPEKRMEEPEESMKKYLFVSSVSFSGGIFRLTKFIILN